jgi:2-methylcitrate dehydratase PrpD
MEAFSASGQPSMMRGMVTGFASKSAALAASLAEAGVTGVPESFEGRYGLFPVFFDNSYERSAILVDLGQTWAMAEIGLKAWPTMRYISSYVDAVRQVVDVHDIVPDQIGEIRVHVAGHVATRCEPLDRQRRPSNYNHAGHAMPYLIAAMAVRRRISIGDLIEGLNDPEVLAVAQRVVPVHDPRYGGDNRLGPAKVVVQTLDGASYERSLEFSYGDPRNPMSWGELTGKFRTCLAYRREPLPEEHINQLIGAVERLEELEKISALTRYLA